METSWNCMPHIPQPFLWTEDAHGLYLSFLEDAFVKDLYERHYCSLDICGCSPPAAAHTSPSSMAVECPFPAPPQPCTVPVPVQSNSNVDPKACRKRSRTGCKASSARRKGKWISQEVGLDTHFFSESGIGPGQEISPLELLGSSSQPFENSNCIVPKRPRGGLKRSRLKAFERKSCDTEQPDEDQVVPSACEEG